MYFSPLLISLPYSSVRVTSGVRFLPDFTKTFYIMLRFLWIVQLGSSFFGSTSSKGVVHLYSSFYIVHPHTRGYHKNLWIVLFSFALAGAKTPLQRFPLAYKSTAANASTLFTERTAKAVVNWLQKFTRLHLFLLFLAICRIRFLTFINNSPIYQRTFHGIIIPFQIRRGGLFLLFPFRGFTNLSAKL